MRNSRVVVLVCSLSAVLACGTGGEAPPAVVESANGVAGNACTAADVDWTGITSDAAKVCSGGFEYSPQCCDAGRTAKKTCKHTHRQGDIAIQNIEIPQVCTKARTPWNTACTFGTAYCTICDAWGPSLPCNETHAQVKDVWAAVQAAWAGCTVDWRVTTAPPAPSVQAFTYRKNSPPGAPAPAANAPIMCTVVIHNVPTAHNMCTLAACDTAPDESCGYVDSLRPEDGRKYEQCTESKLGGRNPDKDPSYPTGTSYGLVAKSYCGLPDKAYTAANTSFATFLTNVQSVHRPTWRCLSGENISLGAGDATGVATKWDELATLANAQPAVNNAATTLLQHRQQFFELFGDRLDATRRAQAEALYAVNPVAVGGACGTRYVRDGIEASCPLQAAVEGKLAMCQRLLKDGHVPLALAELEADSCVAAASAASALPAACVHLRAEAASVGTELLRKVFAWFPEQDPNQPPAGLESPDSFDPARKARLQRRLATIQNHYDALKKVESGDALWRDVTTATGAFLRGAYLQSVNRINPAVAGASLLSQEQALATGYVVDREVLNALLTAWPQTNQPPLTKAPALLVLSDAMRSMSDRLVDVDFLHDFGCRFRDCRHGLQTEVSQLHALLGSMNDPAWLTSTANNASSLVRRPWRDIFKALEKGPGATVMTSAITDATGVAPSTNPGAVFRAGLNNPPAYAFAQVVAASKAKADSYRATGQFRGDFDVNRQYFGLLGSMLPFAKSNVETARSSLATAVSEVSSSRVTLLNQQMSYMSGVDDVTNLVNRLNQKGAEIKNLFGAIEGMRIAATVDKERFGSLGKSYEDAIRRLQASYSGEYVQAAFPARVVPVAAEATKLQAGVAPSDIAAIALAGPFVVTPGDLVLVAAQGDWSPTCAAQLVASQYQLTGVTSATTGPQGFSLSYANGTFSLQSHTVDDYSYWEDSTKVCASASIEVGVPIVPGGPPIGGSVKGSAEACHTTGNGRRTSDVTSNGTDYRSTAAFNAGLRLPNTPFPEYPAGALLAVTVRPVAGTTVRGIDRIVDVAVIQAPATTLLVEKMPNVVDALQGQEIYLVPNEVNSPSCTRAAGHAMTVTVKGLRGKERAALELQKAMAETYGWLEDTLRRTILPQHDLLPAQAKQLENEANMKLLLACQGDTTLPLAERTRCDLASFDQDLMQIYRTWVSYALADAERQVRMNKLQREMTIATMEWEALATQVVQQQRRNEIAWLLPAWTARSVDADHVRSSARDFVTAVEQHLYPFLLTKYPYTLTGNPDTTAAFRGIPGSAVLQGSGADPGLLAKLTTKLDWAFPFTTAAGDASAAMAEIIRLLDIEVGQVPPVEQPSATGADVVIMFTKPVTSADGSVVYVDPDLPGTDYPGTWASGLFRPASPERAQAFWDALIAGSAVEFDVLATDIYDWVRATDASGRSIPRYPGFQLSCEYSVPVIKAMGLFAATNTPGEAIWMNATASWVPASASPDTSYVLPSHAETFFMADSRWRTIGQLPVFYGTQEQVGSMFTYGASAPYAPGRKPIEFQAGAGLSATSRFVIPAGYRDTLDPVESGFRFVAGIGVILRVEFRQLGRPTWVPNCNPEIQ